MGTSSNKGPVFWQQLKDQATAKLEKLRSEERIPMHYTAHGLTLFRDALQQAVTSLEDYRFADKSEEIAFYKQIAWYFQARIHFFSRAYRLECGRPPGDKTVVEIYFQEALSEITGYARQQDFIFRYLRSGSDYLDDRIYSTLPGPSATLLSFIAAPPETLLSGQVASVIAQLQAGELLQEYIIEALAELKTTPAGGSIGSRMIWTDSKTALIELAYALQSAGSLNQGKAELREIIEFLESAFHISLDHYPRLFQDILSRKMGYTNYLDRLRDKLLLRIDLIEEKHIR